MIVLPKMVFRLLLASFLLLSSSAWSSEVTTKLLNSGNEPKQVMRYSLEEGQSEKISMQIKMNMSMEIGDKKNPEMQLPENIMKMSMKVTEVTKEGNYKYIFTFDDIEVGEDSSLPTTVVEQIRNNLATITGVSGSGTLTPTGESLGAEIEIGPDVTPQIKNTLDEFKRSLDNMSTPLPKEAVGVGARWETTYSLEMNSFTLQQTATYTLKGIKNGLFDLDVKMTQTAPPQEMKLPEAPDTKVMLEEMSSEGNGKLQINLKKITPTSEIKVKTGIKLIAAASL